MNKKEFGSYLRTLRKEKGLTLVELANLTGVSNPYISQIENGKFLPSPDILEKLAKGLEVSSVNLLLKSGHLGEDAAKEVQSKGLKVYLEEFIEDLTRTYENIDESSSDHLKDKKKKLEPLLKDIENIKNEISMFNDDIPEGERAIQEKYLIGEIDQEERKNLFEDEFGITEKKEKIKNLESKIENLNLIKESTNNNLDIMRLINQDRVSFLGKELSRSDKLKISKTIAAILSDHAPNEIELHVTDSHKKNKINFDIDSTFYSEE